MPIPSFVARLNRRFVGRLMMPLAGHGWFGELEHRGRRSGATYRIPIMAFPSPEGDTVTIALTYGPRVDWLRNLRAAGGGRIRLGAQWLTLGPPLPLTTQAGLARMPWVARRVLPLIRSDAYVELPVLAREPVSRR